MTKKDNDQKSYAFYEIGLNLGELYALYDKYKETITLFFTPVLTD